MTDEEIFTEAVEFAVMGPKLKDLLSATRLISDEMPGAVAEVGVYKGGSGLLLCRAFEKRVVYLIDTFTGIPENDSMILSTGNGHLKGDFSDTSYGSVHMMLSERVENWALIKADVRHFDTEIIPDKFCFVNLDADIEQSTSSAFQLFSERMVTGGIIFFDDYGSRKCAGVKKTVEAAMETGEYRLTVNHGTCFLTKL